MAPYREGQLEFSFPAAAQVVKFDDPTSHGVSAMKAVDFIVELPDCDLYVEVKDPDDTTADETRRNAFLAKLKSGKLENDLVYKYRDSLSYRWCEGKSDKPVRYVVLLQLSTLLPRDYQLWTDKLKARLPLVGPTNWIRKLVDKAWVMNMDTWNKMGIFGEVRRS